MIELSACMSLMIYLSFKITCLWLRIRYTDWVIKPHADGVKYIKTTQNTIKIFSSSCIATRKQNCLFAIKAANLNTISLFGV